MWAVSQKPIIDPRLLLKPGISYPEPRFPFGPWGRGCQSRLCFYNSEFTQQDGRKKRTANLDCLQSAFSLKIRLVLISSSAVPNHDVIITETRREKTVSYYFFLGLRPRFSRFPASPLACLGFACGNFAKKNKRLLAV